MDITTDLQRLIAEVTQTRAAYYAALDRLKRALAQVEQTQQGESRAWR